MSIFNPVHSRKNALELIRYQKKVKFIGGIKGFLGIKKNSVEQEFTDYEYPYMFASSRINSLIQEWLLGLSAEIYPDLVKYNSCLEEYLTRYDKARLSPSQLEGSYAFSSWMIDGQNNLKAHQLALDGFDEYFKQGWVKYRPDVFNYKLQKFERNEITGLPVPDKEILKEPLADYLAHCIQCGEYARGVSLYERVGGRKIVSSKKLKTALGFGYWVCKQKSENIEIPHDEYLEAGERVLINNLQENWLGYGQYLRAANWLKVVYWHTGVTKTPLETILKAYDVMPDVVKPDFLKM